MRAKIINKDNNLYNREIIVCYLRTDKIAGIDIVTKKPVVMPYEDIELKFDNDWEEKVINQRDILEIKKPDEASNYMYYAILNSIEEHIGEEISELIVVEDKDMSSKKKLWIKTIMAFVNGSPIKINMSGQRYSNVYDIRISSVDKDEFVDYCQTESNKLENGLLMYTKRLNGLMYTIDSLKN